jgi:hypothetical protein
MMEYTIFPLQVKIQVVGVIIQMKMVNGINLLAVTMEKLLI